MSDLTPEHIAQGITYFVVLLFSLSFHESAHAWMASRMGDNTARDLGRVSLNPIVHIDLLGTVLIPLIQIFGPSGIPLMGWAKPTPVQPGNFAPGQLARGQILVAGAGPVSNLILALVFTAGLFVAVRLGLSPETGAPVLKLITTGVLINIALAVFNLLPLPPLDGSHVASWGLPRPLAETYDRVMGSYGQFLLLILFVTGVLSWVTTPIIIFLRNLLYAIAL
ncbi:MAG TPA: site-2 protease family protein [Vicinamibacteria bacterium]